MKTETIHKIIQRKNEDLEQEAVAEARSLIDAIGSYQRAIAETEKQIADCRKRLAELEIAQLDATKILG